MVTLAESLMEQIKYLRDESVKKDVRITELEKREAKYITLIVGAATSAVAAAAKAMGVY